MFQTLHEILVDRIRIAPDGIAPEATPEDIDLDSLAMVELSVALEEVGIAITEGELKHVATVGDIAELMQERA
ncbi:acyl carrier protein [Saccharopolyspora sp. HNM0983]|uniref:Acyl carrier protein n=1 Tax=Saccharopolyspora montiporae TaxID=2781240 RepID=A0A929BBZ8_9PSEU|nr:phosphopantetheine-binding protein [Saccharopolyspora sp. HNM0983]MBE9375975.1 acyl carrier protein [Saccharopolyspora sp. HNM0983]